MKRTSTSQSVDPQNISQSANTSDLKQQILGNRYLNMEKLEELLNMKFGDNWKVQVSTQVNGRQQVISADCFGLGQTWSCDIISARYSERGTPS
jgi:hypothetical protein